jgi:hypothetical protein
MRTRRLLAVLGLAGILALGGLDAAAGDEPGGRAAAATPPAGATVCERLEARVAQVPGIRARILTRIATIEARLDAVRDPRRRARLDATLVPRLEALRTLDTRLADQVAAVEARCAAPA